MSGYPDPDYAAPPDYTVESGTNCSNAKPYRFWDGAHFCSDVTVSADLEVTGNVTISGNTVIRARMITEELQVQELEFRAVRLPPFDNYYVLASYIPPSNGNS
jgi:hypothetical protein